MFVDIAQQRTERGFEISGGQALEIEFGEHGLYGVARPLVPWQELRTERLLAIAYARRADLERPTAHRDLAGLPGPIPVPTPAPGAVLITRPPEKLLDFLL